MKLIGINGGTFDPIHYGHLRPALEVMQQLNLSEVQFIPCYQPVHKEAANVSAPVRCEMIELAIKNQPKFHLNDIEVVKGGPSYMVDTLKRLKQNYVEEALVLMMGTDAFVKFHTWHQWQEIIQLANIVIMHRPGEAVPLDCTSGRIYQKYKVDKFTQTSQQMMDLAVTQLDISSTQIRDLIAQGQSVEYLLQPCVMDYINQQGLYNKPA